MQASQQVQAEPSATLANSQRYFSSPQAAAYLNLSEPLLEKLRVQGGGPSFVRITATGGGKRGRIIYAVEDLDAFMASRKQRSTSDVRRRNVSVGGA